jgi:hypothetical protein
MYFQYTVAQSKNFHSKGEEYETARKVISWREEDLELLRARGSIWSTNNIVIFNLSVSKIGIQVHIISIHIYALYEMIQIT